MSLRKQMVLLATFALTLSHLSPAITALPKGDGGGRFADPPKALVLPAATKLNEVQKAYVDSYSILSSENSCSRFFGGRPAIAALNDLIKQVRQVSLSKDISMRMRGQSQMFMDARTGFSYRLFKTAEVNINGPFYQGNELPNRPLIPRVGRFLPNTREARTAVLLHELGHLIRNSDGAWLLHDDGDNPDLSRENTSRILTVCEQQIRELHKHTFQEELLAMEAEQVDPNAVAARN